MRGTLTTHAGRRARSGAHLWWSMRSPSLPVPMLIHVCSHVCARRCAHDEAVSVCMHTHTHTHTHTPTCKGSLKQVEIEGRRRDVPSYTVNTVITHCGGRPLNDQRGRGSNMPRAHVKHDDACKRLFKDWHLALNRGDKCRACPNASWYHS